MLLEKFSRKLKWLLRYELHFDISSKHKKCS